MDDSRLFTTPDRIIAAAATFTDEGFERSFEEILATPLPAPWPERRERPVRAMRSACRPLEATA